MKRSLHGRTVFAGVPGDVVADTRRGAAGGNNGGRVGGVSGRKRRSGSFPAAAVLYPRGGVPWLARFFFGPLLPRPGKGNFLSRMDRGRGATSAASARAGDGSLGLADAAGYRGIWRK